MRALLGSRALVWVAGMGAVLLLGAGASRSAYHAPGLTGGFGPVGDLLFAPAARWDAAWYLTIAHYGYMPQLGPFTAARAAFFPLYPLLVSIVSATGIIGALAGILVSLAALLGALYGLHRLTEMEVRDGHLPLARGAASAGLGARGNEVARLAVLLCAFSPMAFFLSADYSEALFLALSVGMFLMARQSRWAAVGVLGGLAAATRSAGVLLAVPAAVFYLYGPRPGLRRACDGPLAASALRRLVARARPRFALRADVAWLALIPAGVVAYMAWLWLAGGEPLAPFHAQVLWERHFAGPFVAVWDGLRAAFEGVRQLASGQSRQIYFPLAGKSPFIQAEHNITETGFMLLAVPAVIGVCRRLPSAYGAYVIAALALPLSYPVPTQPLMSLPRFLLVLFPFYMWLAAYLLPRPRAKWALLGVSAAALFFFAGAFSTWHWVA